MLEEVSNTLHPEVKHPTMSIVRLERIEKINQSITFYTRVLKGFTSMGQQRVINIINSYLEKLEEAEKELEIQLCYMQLEAGL